MRRLNPEALKQRARQKIVAFSHVDSNGCWLWTKAKHKDGYAEIYFLGRKVNVHRVAFLVFKGPIPESMQVDHLCKVRHCCNPEHLRLVTIAQNCAQRTAWDPNRTGRIVKPAPSKLAVCFNGHELTPENSFVEAGRKQPHCRTCRKQANVKYRQRRAAA